MDLLVGNWYDAGMMVFRNRAWRCRADADGDGELNILDFVCFQGLFQAGCD